MTNTSSSSPDVLKIDICVCTFQRPHIQKTLKSLAQMALRPNRTVRIIVADNDDTPTARSIVETTARECRLTLTYLHAPARNISIARNACLDTAQSPLVAFIDDDEIATPGWLEALISEYQSSHADIVLGKVQAIYGPECPDWMRKGDFHSPKPIWVNGQIITGYTCNVLLRRDAPALQGLRFRPELGRSGGEDTVFFAAAHKAGGKLAYAPDAVVTEIVAPARAHFSWLMKRSFRSGQTHGMLLLEDKGTGLGARVKAAAIAGAKAAFCLTGAILNAAKPYHMRNWILRGTLHIGVISRLLGKRELEQYG